MNKTGWIGILLLVAAMFGIAAVSAGAWSYTTVNSFKAEEYEGTAYAKAFGDIVFEVSNGIQIEAYETSDAGCHVTIGIDGGGTNALLDGVSHTDTVAQAVTRGSLIYGNSTLKWDELLIGTAGQVPTSDGTDFDWATPAAGGAIGGDSNDIQYNNAGVFGGEDAFEYNASTNTLTVDDADVADEITCDSIHVGGTADPGANNIRVDGDVQGGITLTTSYVSVFEADDDGVLVQRSLQDETVTAGVISPGVPRCISITVIAGIDTASGNIQINGIDADGGSIDETEAFSVASPGSETKYTDRAFARITSIVVTGSGGTLAEYKVGWNDTVGFVNFPWAATTDLFKVSIGQPSTDDTDPTDYTISATYGTVKFDDVAAIVTGDAITIWYRPYLTAP